MFVETIFDTTQHKLSLTRTWFTDQKVTITKQNGFSLLSGQARMKPGFVGQTLKKISNHSRWKTDIRWWVTYFLGRLVSWVDKWFYKSKIVDQSIRREMKNARNFDDVINSLISKSSKRLAGSAASDFEIPAAIASAPVPAQ